jgi:hypothetical protein
MSYCSLEEAWGETYAKTNEDNPEQIKSNKNIDYSGGKQFSNELVPQVEHDVYENTVASNSNRSNFVENEKKSDIYMKNKDDYAIVPYNMDKEQLWNEFLEYVKQKKEFEKQHSNINTNTNIRESFGNTINKKPKYNNSYVDLLILIMFGIIVIFILDSFVRFGRKSKKD